jgi:Lipopolysaccharide-assembly
VNPRHQNDAQTFDRERNPPAAMLSRRGAMWGICALVAAMGTAALCGCATYRFGNASLYPQDIETVYLPVFESDSFRRNLAEFLTEAIAKEIQLKTPYTVVGTPEADSVLTGKITTDTKRVIIEDAYDYPRETQINMSIEVRWVNRRGDLVNQAATIPMPSSLVTLSGNGTVVPEFGQSVSTAQLQAIQSLATQIVSLMESPW